MISDLFLAFFPVLLLWNIQMPRRSKVGLCSLMGLGLVTAGLCLTRTILNWENINHDPTWESIPNWGFRNWEITVGIILASIPALRPGYRVCATALARYNSAHTGSTRPSNPSHDRHSHHRTMFPTDPPRRLSNKTYGFSDDILLQSTAVDNDSRHSVAADEADEKARFARELARPSQLPSWETTSRAAGHTARVEVDRPAAAGEGDEAVAMKRLSGGVEVGERGITKTVWFGTETEPEENQRRSSGGGGDLERGESGRAFV
ncbi:MAG: hypothetical protein M1822_009691 [Bathelium mastoideum]|nr:MAG: hypothetical protein M1822_009691 [Bathelium mastoideum]